MSTRPITILFFSDSHLGFDLPVHPRIQVRRRGHDFFSNYQHILDTALAIDADLIIHGGDFFFRSRVPPSIVEKAYQPLAVVAQAGIPIYLVPGNHERSKLPAHLWLSHSNIHVFDQPGTFQQRINNTTISLSGFPFARKVRQNFEALLQQCRFQESRADIRLLCMHQAVEGAKVGPSDFTFRSDPDTISGSQLPPGFSAILSGHIHRSQVLSHSLQGQLLPAPVIYSGSIERTSFAERYEEKHFVILRIDPASENPAPIIEFHPLPSRPMIRIEIPVQFKGYGFISTEVNKELANLDPDSVVRIHFTGQHAEEAQGWLSASKLRNLAPPSMNISLDSPWRR